MYKIGVVIFPQVEELDFVGPFEVLSYINKLQPESTKVYLVAQTLEPVYGFNGMGVLPHTTFQDCPELDILVVPGGKGRIIAMKDEKLRDFVLAKAKECSYITSVCTGAFILAEAGLLHGKRCTTYHSALDELRTYPQVTVVAKQKVVEDGQIISAGGVSSGLELGFYLLSSLFNGEIAQKVADAIEYSIDVKNFPVNNKK